MKVKFKARSARIRRREGEVMKVKKTVITWVITALFLLLAGWYGITILWALRQDGDVPGIIRWGLLGAVFLILGPVMVMMIITAVRRKREIDAEDEDDLGQY